MSDQSMTSGEASAAFVEIKPAAAPPVISVLMPLYQQAGFVAHAVASILAQRRVVAEILISDDGSTDGTFQVVQQAVARCLAASPVPHRILLRRGTARLHRDHVPLLIDKAGCNLVVQAHGDDLFNPLRLAAIVLAFQGLPNAVLLASQFEKFSDDGSALREWENIPLPIPVADYSPEAVVTGTDPHLIGCTQAWRKDVVAKFGRLDMSVAATSHDRILPFRALLCGGVHQIQLPLVRRREHPRAWTRQMVDANADDALVSWELMRINVQRRMLADLALAEGANWIASADADRYKTMIRDLMEGDLTRLFEAFNTQVRAFKRISWVPEGS